MNPEQVSECLDRVKQILMKEAGSLWLPTDRTVGGKAAENHKGYTNKRADGLRVPASNQGGLMLY